MQTSFRREIQITKCSNQKLRPKERLFCVHYVETGNIKESAIKAGFKGNHFKVGCNLLLREDVNKEIELLYERKKKNLIYRACSGYERLAFGEITDAVKLIYSGNLVPDKISSMDLFNISEIKRLKDGAVEIKFFDRIRALEKIQNMDFTSNEQSETFYSAIQKGTSAFEKVLDE